MFLDGFLSLTKKRKKKIQKKRGVRAVSIENKKRRKIIYIQNIRTKIFPVEMVKNIPFLHCIGNEKKMQNLAEKGPKLILN